MSVLEIVLYITIGSCFLIYIIKSIRKGKKNNKVEKEENNDD